MVVCGSSIVVYTCTCAKWVSNDVRIASHTLLYSSLSSMSPLISKPSLISTVSCRPLMTGCV